MDTISAEHIRRNRQTRHCWDLYAEHRRRVTDLLLCAARRSRQARVCILGAGNANDLALARLVERFREVHLVDLDAEALEFALSRQQPCPAERIVCHGGIDVTGAFHILAHGGPGEPLANPAALLQTPAPSLPGPFDVVASVGLLTQLIDSALMAVGAIASQSLEIVQAIRLRHLRLLVELTRPGGEALLVTEVVSSDTYRPLYGVSAAELPAVLRCLIEQRNFFTGTNPAVIEALFREDPVLAGRVEHVEVLPPWKWQFISRVYAVVGYRVRRKSGSDAAAL